MPRFFSQNTLPQNTRRVCAAAVTLPQSNKKTSWVTLTRTGSFTDPRYGRFDITPQMLAQMVQNFDANVVGTDIFLDVNHVPGDGSAAKILKLSVEGNRLRALVEWTDFGLAAVKERGFTYLSAEYHENWQDNEAGAFHGTTLLGAGLTVRPVIKRLDPVTLSCEADGSTVILSELADDLITKAKQNMNELEKFLKKLAEMGYSETVVATIKELAALSINENTDEAAVQTALIKLEATAKILAQGEADAKKLADSTAGLPEVQDEKQSLAQVAATAKLTMDDVNVAVAKALAEREIADKKLAEKRTAYQKILADEIGAAQGLDDDLKRELTESASKLLHDALDEHQVKALAVHHVKLGGQMTASKQLAAMGYTISGSPHITTPDNTTKQLSGIYAEKLKQTGVVLALAESTSPFVAKVLAEFDRRFASELANEAKLLSGSQTDMRNTSLPYGVQREVIKEALHDLNVLNLVQQYTDFAATATTLIPYEIREMASVMNEGIVAEGHGIPFAGVSQHTDTVFVNQMKLALSVSNEVVHFTRTSAINWDALARNIQSNARIVRELVARRIVNEIQRVTDTFQAIEVIDESLQVATDNGIFKTVHFPVVRPHQITNLQGQAVGLPENPITLKISGNAVTAFDGSGEQSSGTYWRIVSLNQGVFQLVDEKGVPKTGVSAATMSYSRASNVVKFNLDVPSGSTLEDHLNGLLRLVGSRKAMLNGQRYEMPDYLLMSPVLNDQISNASEFVAERKRNGSHTNTVGDLETIKGLPAFGTNAPNVDLGDDRIIIGRRGLTAYTIVKPFVTGDLFELTDGKGRPIGKKAAYGEEYNAIHTPTPLRGGCTSIVVYSATDRAKIGT